MSAPSLARSPRRLTATPRATPRRTALSAILVVVSLASACAGGSGPPASSAAPAASSPSVSGERTVIADRGSYTSVSPGRLADMLAENDFVLVNVHIPYEGEIDGTDVSLPYDQIAKRIGELPAAKVAKIFVYCRSGRMSAIAATTLVGLGYTNVWELDGGMIAWGKRGHQRVQRTPA